MALFTLRDSWSCKAEAGEEFDSRAFCVGALASLEGSRVVTGSLGGTLRVFRPQLREFQVDDLEAEVQLEEPILQVEIGRFVSQGAQGEKAVAVLHPRALAVYNLVEKEAGYVQLEKKYSHVLGDGGEHFSAANMVYGPFGGVRGKDFIAVQSLDGQIHVFEQESFAFIRQLNHVLLPGPLAYARKIDSFLVSNSQYQVDCYKYHVLASSTSRVSHQNQKDPASSLQTDWTFTVGEQILDIQCTRVSKGIGPAQIDIFILSDRSIYCLTERGVVRTHVRLEVGCNPMCCTTLPILSPPGDCSGTDALNRVHNLAVFSETAQLSVFKEFQLVWSATMDIHVPVAVALARIDKVDGMIVTFSDDGRVIVSYLGTDVSDNLILPKATRTKVMKGGAAANEKENESKSSNRVSDEMKQADDMEYDEMDREHRKLMDKIRNLHKDMRREESRNSSDTIAEKESILVRAQVPASLDVLTAQDNVIAQSEDSERQYAYRDDGQVVQLTVKLFIAFKGIGSAKDVHIQVQLPDPFVCAESSFTFDELHGQSEGGKSHSPLILHIPIRVKNDLVPASLTASVACSFKNRRGALKFSSFSFRLPLFLATKVRQPVKSSSSKITIDSDQEVVRLAVLFDDMLRQPGLARDIVESISGSASNVVSFEFYCGGSCTVLASKTGSRYRLQGGGLASLGIVTDELCHRLREKFGRDEAVQFSFQEDLPLNGLFSVLDKHHASRLGQLKAMAALNDRSHQYRLVQKRLLSRFKDKNAPSLRGLDTLLNVTHVQVMKAASSFEKEQRKSDTFGCELAACVQLINFLVSLKHPNLSREDLETIDSVLSPSVRAMDGPDMGWEELTDLSITHLLRTTLAKVPKGTADLVGAPANKPLIAADTSKLKKHISIFLDRLAKGARPSWEALEEEKDGRVSS